MKFGAVADRGCDGRLPLRILFVVKWTAGFGFDHNSVHRGLDHVVNLEGFWSTKFNFLIKSRFSTVNYVMCVHVEVSACLLATFCTGSAN